MSKVMRELKRAKEADRQPTTRQKFTQKKAPTLQVGLTKSELDFGIQVASITSLDCSCIRSLSRQCLNCESKQAQLEQRVSYDLDMKDLEANKYNEQEQEEYYGGDSGDTLRLDGWGRFPDSGSLPEYNEDW